MRARTGQGSTNSRSASRRCSCARHAPLDEQSLLVRGRMKRRAHPEIRDRRELFSDKNEGQTRTPPRRHAPLLQHFFEGAQMRLRRGTTQLTATAARPALAAKKKKNKKTPTTQNNTTHHHNKNTR